MGESAQQELLRKSENTLRSMQEIAAELPLDFEAQVRQILAFGSRQFDLPIAMLSRVGDDGLSVIETHGTGESIGPGAVLPLRETFCSETLRSERILSFNHAALSRWRDHPAYAALGLEAYIGTPLRVGGQIFGTLCFASSEPRPEPFSPSDEEILRLMAQRIEIGLEHHQMEQSLRAVLEGTAATTGENFLRSLVRHLALALDVRYVFVTGCGDPALTRARTLAFWSGDGFADNFDYEIAGTPCEAVLRANRVVSHPAALQRHYSHDRGLARLGAESYVGLPALDSAGRVVGHLAAMDVRPMPPQLHREWVLRIFAARAGAEIERQQVERELRESEERYSLATGAAKIGIWDWNLRNNDFYLDPNVKALLGYADHEVPNDFERWAEFVHPDDREAVMSAATDHIEGRAPSYVFEHRMRHRDGTYRWFQVRGHAMRDDADEVVRMVGTDADITERKQLEQKRDAAEEALQRSEARFRTLVEQTPAIAYSAEPGPENAATYVAPQVESVTGFSQQEWCTRPSRWRSLLHPDDRDRVLDELQVALRTTEPFSTEYRLRTKDGEWIWIRDLGRLVSDEAGRGLFFQGLMFDVTERKRVDQELRESQKLESLGLLAGGVAHDFNNLLTSVLGNATLALRHLPADAVLRKKIERIETAAERAADLTRQMLAYSGKGRLVVEPVNLDALVDEMAELLQTAISKKATLRRHPAEALPAIEGDATQLRQVVMNLITNASDALHGRTGAIDVSTGTTDANELVDSDWRPTRSSGDRFVFLEIRDDGDGMDANTRLRMFDPFFSTRFAGRGLGLAAVLGIVRGHHGAIRVESEPRRGTTIRLLFPASDRLPSQAAGPMRPDLSAWRGSGTVLIIDDEDGVREVARTVLESAGFEVISAIDGVDGVERFRERAAEITLVLLDLTMPRMGGEEALSALRRVRADVPVVLMTGYSEQQAIHRVSGDQIAGFLHKPYSLDELIETIRSIVES